jgi:hypothetical protein
MKWTKIEPEGEERTPIWNQPNPDGSFLKEMSDLVGEFKSVKENVGANKSNLYFFNTDRGEVAVWGSTVLDDRLSNLEEGDTVRIVYLGTAEGKSGRQYRNYDVFRGSPTEDEVDIDKENRL